MVNQAERDKQKEQLKKLVNRNFGKYKGRVISFEKQANSKCNECGNDRYEIKLAKDKGKSMYSFMVSVAIIVLLPVIFYVVIKILASLGLTLSSRGITNLLIMAVSGGIGLAIFLENKKSRKVICKQCDKEFVDA